MSARKKETKPRAPGGGRKAFRGPSMALSTLLPEAAEPALQRGVAIHGTIMDAVSQALLLAYPPHNEAEKP